MTILARIEGRNYELTVCGTPNKEWLDWLLTATVPLTKSQIAWRELHRNASEGTGPQQQMITPAAKYKNYPLLDGDEPI